MRNIASIWLWVVLVASLLVVPADASNSNSNNQIAESDIATVPNGKLNFIKRVWSSVVEDPEMILDSPWVGASADNDDNNGNNNGNGNGNDATSTHDDATPKGATRVPTQPRFGLVSAISRDGSVSDTNGWNSGGHANTAESSIDNKNSNSNSNSSNNNNDELFDYAAVPESPATTHTPAETQTPTRRQFALILLAMICIVIVMVLARLAGARRQDALRCSMDSLSADVAILQRKYDSLLADHERLERSMVDSETAHAELVERLAREIARLDREDDMQVRRVSVVANQHNATAAATRELEIRVANIRTHHQREGQGNVRHPYPHPRGGRGAQF